MKNLSKFFKHRVSCMQGGFGRQKYSNTSGQALLIILLILAGTLTIVLSTASKSVTDIQTTGLEEDSVRAFNAAELGVEQALLKQGIATGTLANQANYNVNIENSEAGSSYIYPDSLMSGEVATFWFVSQAEDGDLICDGDHPCTKTNNIRFCFGDDNVTYASNPAIEVTIYYDSNAGDPLAKGVNTGDFSGVKTARYAFDSLNARTTNNNFTAATQPCNVSGLSELRYRIPQIMANDQVTCNPAANEGCLLMATVRSLYNTQPNKVGLNVVGASTLPAQGVTINSTGVSGEASRKINVQQTYGEVPGIFDTAIYSKSDISK
ncbi:hypothetical protein IPM62_02950 [Candidatus Woesebacteria bacterium]|nr:MAG: hypothetical protein IPM62_02950 [Candidatus Woesebacteria bacterium]